MEFTLKLVNEGAIGSSRFRFIVKKSYDTWNHLEKTAKQTGPIVSLPNNTEVIMEKTQYEFLRLVEDAPNPRDKDKVFNYVAEVRSKAKELNVTLNNYLEKQEYLFVDQIDMDLSYDKKTIKLEPQYKSTDEIEEDVLKEMGKSAAIYKSGADNKKIFVNKDIYEKAKEINNVGPIEGANIARFVENPESFIPEIEGLDLSLFGERVRQLGIQVYRAQPYIHAKERDRGWFALNIGVSVMDETGESQGEFKTDEIESLIREAQNSGEEYIEWNGHWLKLPHETTEFIDATNRLKETIDTDEQVDFSKLPYVLEIYENINHLEFNQPILEVKKEMDDLGVLNLQPPQSFLAHLKPFQIDGYVWMKSLQFRKIGGLLADDMGLGKTIQVISFLAYLQEINKLTPTLIVVPKTLIENWRKEIQKFAPLLVTSFYNHQGPERIKNPSQIEKKGIVITTYQTLVKDQIAMGQVNWQAVVCDEAQAIKNPSTAASRVLKALKSKFRLALTGTPVENSLTELWSIMDYVQPGLLGSLKDFKNEFITPFEEGEDVKPIETKLISKLSHVYKRRTKEKELEGQLPPKISKIIEVGLGPLQKKMYGDVISLVGNKMMTGLEAIQKLKALTSHPALVNEQYINLNVEEIPKLNKTMDIIESIREKDEKVLIFTEYIKMQGILRNHIREQFHINPNIINGMTSRRQQVVDFFNQKPGFDVMILSPKAAGTGLTITSANNVIHYTRWWNPAVENQATDRVYRIGQEKPVTVYYPIVKDSEGIFASGTVEEIVHRVIEEKKDLASSVIVPSKKLDLEKEILGRMRVN
ncbi:DEAD/DEAH box helicase [Pueribacillus theae]|uniref:DEAD/DEAH box helicase n=1 Tax=Pueribacillus theae TaxID=2171751 RepID=UPI0014035FDD|nr:DEAD/DEAH box helicase [Pueribacillus theae]